MKQPIAEGIKKKKIVKFLLSDITYATRDKKEIELLNSMGCVVLVYCSGEHSENYITDTGITIQKIERLRLSYAQSRISRILKIIGRNIVLIKTLRSFKADCVSCHDLEALFLGWMSGLLLFKANKPILVYDSHEFELGRNTSGKRGLFKKKILTILEKFLIGKSAITMMVNDSIAQDVQEIYRLEEKPLVVRNIPPYWHINHEVSLERRKAYCQALKAPDNSFILMYHGAITTNRGIEQLISATREIPDCIIILLGFGNDQYLTILKKHISDCKMENRILFLDAVPLNILWEYIGASDVGIMLDQNTCKSYYYSLPNKLFENIQSEKMVIGSNFPEYRQIIEGYNIGLCCNPHDAAEITESIRKIKNNLLLRDQFKNNLLTAKEVLCWENEKEILQTAYSGLLSKIK